MTTPLASEPIPDDGQVPYMSTLVDRLYRRLPEIYRVMDARDSCWVLKRYLGAVLHQAGVIDDTIDAITGNSPVGPATPEPWGLPIDELTAWQDARASLLSTLGDPTQANEAWLPWLAQLVGVRLTPGMTTTEQRAAIQFATSGYRAGTRQSLIEAARPTLTGTQYARVLAHTKPSGGVLIAGSPWDITIVTRVSETPDPAAVLAAVLRKNVKPAGVVLWHYGYEASWADVAAAYPTWADWNTATWLDLAEAGI